MRFGPIWLVLAVGCPAVEETAVQDTASADETPPTVTAVFPAHNAVGVDRSTEGIRGRRPTEMPPAFLTCPECAHRCWASCGTPAPASNSQAMRHRCAQGCVRNL